MKEEHTRKFTTDSIVYMVTVAVCMIAAVICCCNKHAMHEDEFYSYYSSNRTYGAVLDGEVSADAVMDELTVRPGEGFNFGMVREVQSWDVHPPLYYFILHLVCSLSQGHFSMWQGLAINLVCYAVCLILMLRLWKVLYGRSSLNEECAPLSPVSAGIAGSVLILAWGLSPATMTGVAFIRMYMLLTVWILAVTLLHLTHIDSGAVRPWFWPALGAITFCGFMTHYYFFIWLFFLAAAWNIREMIFTRRLKTTILYGITMVVTFGLCYLFYPAFPAQMFRGQRGAQAVGNFLDVGNTAGRIGSFASIVNRMGFGSMLWVMIGICVILYLLDRTRRRGARPHTGVWTPDEKTERMYYAAPAEAEQLTAQDVERKRNLAILIPVCIAYFLAVSKTALMLGDSSIRYQMPVMGVGWACLFAVLLGNSKAVTSAFSPDKARNRNYALIAACLPVAVAMIVMIAYDVRGGISFLYPKEPEHIDILAGYPDASCCYVYPAGQSWVAWADMTELMNYEEVTYISSDEYSSVYNSDMEVLSDRISKDHAVIVYIDRDMEVPEAEGHKLLFTNEYTDVYVAK